MAQTSFPIGVVTNPNARKNRFRPNRREALQDIVGGLGRVAETRSVAEIRDVVDEFMDAGVRYWVSDGGDGSLHWLVNQVHDAMTPRTTETAFESGELLVPTFVPTNGGTIDFVAKKAGIRGRAEGILAALVRAHREHTPPRTSVIPSMTIRLTTRQGDRTEIVERIGFATAVAGVPRNFMESYYREDRVPGPKTIVKLLGKTVLGVAGSLPSLSGLPIPKAYLAYPSMMVHPLQADVEVDGKPLPYTRFTSIQAGAININLGGVIKVFDRARPGRFHLQALDASARVILRNLPNLFTGRRLRVRHCHDAPVAHARIAAASGEVFAPYIDGEPFRDVTAVEILAGPEVRVTSIDGRR